MGMIYDEKNPPPTVEERYGAATNASNLKVEARRQLPADLLIAAGWSPSRLGAALLRLHSEWDGAEKPPRPQLTKERLERIAADLPRLEVGNSKDVLDIKRARHQAHEWHMHELKILFQKLKTMPEVRQQLSLWAHERGIEEPEEMAARVLSWWLDHICLTCGGHGRELFSGSPVLSKRKCRDCNGTGSKVRPSGMGSRDMLDHIDRCLIAARVSIRQRLHPRASRNE